MPWNRLAKKGKSFRVTNFSVGFLIPYITNIFRLILIINNKIVFSQGDNCCTFVLQFMKMHFLNKSITIICLIAFAISTIGVSVQMHSCKMSGQTKVALFPEIFGKTLSCCEVAKPAGNHHENSIQTVPCCNNVFKYSKISSLYNTFSGNNPFKYVLNVPDFGFVQEQITDFSNRIIAGSYRPPPEKLFGKILLHFIHNIKVDLPC